MVRMRMRFLVLTSFFSRFYSLGIFSFEIWTAIFYVNFFSYCLFCETRTKRSVEVYRVEICTYSQHPYTTVTDIFNWYFIYI